MFCDNYNSGSQYLGANEQLEPNENKSNNCLSHQLRQDSPYLLDYVTRRLKNSDL